VRRGLAEALDRGAVAVAFCDADGKYDPAELERLVMPILEGRADYVVGSRFAGTIQHMLARRRLGNELLTSALAFVAGTAISDGQSGYRALSCAAAAAAEIGHDYNYAEVLTLDLLAKGYRYQEVPITYRYRTTSRSFVSPLHYLRRVIPSLWRELNSQSPLAGLGLAQGQAGGPRGVGGGRTVTAPAGHTPRGGAQAGRPATSQLAWTGRPPLHKLPTDKT
jgi:hypothetical protein